MTVAGLSPVGVLGGFGLFLISTGLFYGLPIPVQPMKAGSALTLTNAIIMTASVSRELFPATGS